MKVFTSPLSLLLVLQSVAAQESTYSPTAVETYAPTPSVEYITDVPTAGEDYTAVPTAGEDYTAVPTEGEDYTDVPTAGEDYTAVPTEGEDYTAVPTEEEDYTAVPTEGEDYTAVPTEGEAADVTYASTEFGDDGSAFNVAAVIRESNSASEHGFVKLAMVAPLGAIVYML
eukprot:scaffold12431_cov94-Cyclotella_meneghiniana.AAC.9